MRDGAELEARYHACVVVHGPALVRYFVRRIQRKEDAADLVADVFLTAWRRIDHVPQCPDEARAWLYSQARGALANYRRGEHRRSLLAHRLRETLRVPITVPAIPDEVAAALERLRDDDRELLCLLAWDGLTSEEAGKVLGTRPAAVRKRLQRLRRRLDAEILEPPEQDPRPVGSVAGGLFHAPPSTNSVFDRQFGQ